MQIFMGFNEIAGYYTNLKKGFEELGLDCTFITRSKHKFGYGGADKSIFADILRYCTKRRREYSLRKSIFALIWFLLEAVLLLMLFIWSLIKCKVFIFGFASTFFYYRELPVLKFFNKTIIYVFHGSDSRPPYLNGSFQDLSIEAIVDRTDKVKDNLKWIEKYADHIISNPPQSHLHERIFISRMFVGSPIEIKKITPSISAKKRECVKVLHAPSLPKAKGSRIIRKIIEEITKEGYNIDYLEMTDKSNDEVLTELSSCDFIVDQLYADFPLTGMVREAASLGKPSVIGGYYADCIVRDYPYSLPVIFCHPDDIGKAIKSMLDNKLERKELGLSAKRFIINESTPIKVAHKFLKIINNNFPKEWCYDPKNIRYIKGYGMHENKTREIVKSIISKKGISSLQLKNKPVLEKKIIDMVQLD